jgi:diguanylate cyclase (GGDEF)-like protein/PAS domain S-box-containing protein
MKRINWIKSLLKGITRSIRKQVILFTISMTMIILGIAAAGLFFFVSKNELANWKGQLIDTAQMTSRSLNMYLQKNNEVMGIIDQVGQDEINSDPQFLDSLITVYSDYREIVILDLDKNILIKSSAKIPLLSNYYSIREDEWFKAAASGKNYISDVNFSTDLVPYLTIARPSVFGGVIAARMDMSVLSDVVKQMQLGKRGRVYIVSGDGHVLAHTDPKVITQNINLWSNPKMKELLQNPKTVYMGEYLSFQGDLVIGAREPISGTTWQVVAEVPVDEAFSGTRGSLIAILFASLTAIFLTSFILIRGLKSMFFEPMEALRKGAETFGSGDFSYRITTPRQIEVATVADSFNLMANQLQGRDEELATQRKLLEKEINEKEDVEENLIALNQTLESRVMERTRELSIMNDQLKQLSSKYTSLVEHIPAVTYEAQVGSSLTATFISPQIEQLTGYTVQEWLGDKKLWRKVIYHEDRTRVLAEYENSQVFDKQIKIEYRMQHKDGTIIWVRDQAIFIRDETGNPLYIQGVLMDITGSKQAEDQLVYSAFHDMLTNLPNRALFMDRLKSAIIRAKRTPEFHFAVLFIDLDNFKMVNDTLGHAFGDQLLITLADSISSCLRSGDTVARIGGDEFVILLEDVRSEDDVTHVVERITFEIKRPVHVEGQDIFTSPSIGIVMNTDQYDQASDILRDADIAMYRAKSLGKSQFVVYDPSLRINSASSLELEGEMHKAIDQDEFFLLYQPIIDLTTDRISGFEALLRWNHPQRGVLTPAEFISIAEDSGMIVPIGYWVIREACRQCVEWQKEYQSTPPLSINVNLSSRQFMAPDLAEDITGILEETGLAPEFLGLEIVEDIFISIGKGAIPILTKLKALGIRLQIDDFGKGYSTFTYLPQFPINTIKIGRSFINRIMSNGSLDVVQAMVHFAHDLGMTAVAEGIETKEQLAQLKDMNCPMGQGFYLGRPLDQLHVDELMSKK